MKALLTIGVMLLVSSAIPANAQFGLGSARTRKKPAAEPAPAPQSAPASSGVTDVKWDTYTIRTANGRPVLIYPGTDPVKATSSPIAGISGNRVLVLPGAKMDGADVDATALQKSFDDYVSMAARGGGAPVQQTLTSLSQGGATNPTTGVDQVTWANGEPRVHLSSGYDVTFSGGNGSKIDVVSPGNVQTMAFKFTEAAHNAAGVAKGLARALGTGLTTGAETGALEGGAWKAQIAGGRGWDQDSGTSNRNNFVPGWVKVNVDAILKAQSVVLADPDRHPYAFTGEKKLREIVGQ